VTLRTMLGIGWSILCGFAGGWLVLMPWALNVQGGGDWTTVTKVSFGTGLGLLVFCLIGLVATTLQIVRLLAPPRRARASESGEQQQQQQQAADQESLDRALLQLATKLVADLEAPAPGQTQPAGPAAAPAAAAPAPNGITTRPQVPSTVPAGPTEGASTPTGGGTPTWRRVDQ
jgi:hypothetical protein